MSPRAAVRLVDVARLAGVAVSTASRALSRPEQVRATTRARVESAASRLGYVPNRIAQSLITGRSRAIVIVVPDISSTFFGQIARSAEDAAEERGYRLFVADMRDNVARERAIVNGSKLVVDGFVLCKPNGSYPPDPALPPFVTINGRLPGAPAVLLDQAQIARVQVEHLIALGHERILYVDAPDEYWAARERRDATERLATMYPVEIAAPRTAHFEAGYELADKLDPSFTAIITFADTQAAGIIQRCAERGIRVPEGLSVVGSNDLPMARMLSPALTTMGTPCNLMGRTAVNLLLDRLEGKSSSDVVKTIRPELIVRKSTAPPPRH